MTAEALRLAQQAEPDAPPKRHPNVGRVSVFDDLAQVAGAWHRLQRASGVAPYGAFQLTDAWLRTIGDAKGVEPAIVVAEDAQGRPLALLPLGVVRHTGLRWAKFLGDTEFNGHVVLTDPDVVWNRATVIAMLAKAGTQARIDLFALKNQRAAWDGHANPLAFLGGQPSASFSHAVRLAPDAEEHFKRTLSKHARKLLRSKRLKLEKLGPIRHRVAASEAEAGAILDAYMHQRTARARLLGRPARTADDPLRAFYLQASASDAATSAPLELHALFCGERIVATFGGTGTRERFSGMFTSFDMDPLFARCSPGEIFVADVITSKCRDGVASFDLGIGEGRYKDLFCPESEPLFDQFLGVTSTGRAAAAVWTAMARGKRNIKQSPRLWSAVQRGRRWIAATGL